MSSDKTCLRIVSGAALFLAASAAACAPSPAATIEVRNDSAPTQTKMDKNRDTFDEAKLSLSTLASAEQTHFRNTHSFVAFPLTPSRVPERPLTLDQRAEWQELAWAPPNPSRYAYRAEVVNGSDPPEARIHVEGIDNGNPVQFDMHVTDAKVWW